jgi:glycosyltransferase involved in cell wall biosynthesis
MSDQPCETFDPQGHMSLEREGKGAPEDDTKTAFLGLPRSSNCVSDLTSVFLSVVIPCRNEERHIARCLDSILANDYPKDRMEILVLDGNSTDHTRGILTGYQQKWPMIRVLDNPNRLIPIAMNIGLRNARGQVVLKIDAHSTYPKDYISKCVESLTRNGADNAGGIARILPVNESLTAKAIALALAHPFASGNAYVKVGAKEPRWADSAAFGCWRKEVLEKLGGWNENLGGSSDMDLNARLQGAGGRILLNPEIQVNYYADATFGSYWKHNFADGVWATYVLKFRSKAWAWRHWVPMAFVLSLLGWAVLALYSAAFGKTFLAILGCYAITNLAASIQISSREGNIKYLLFLPLTFGIRHFAHGIGALYGLVLLALPGKHWKGRRSPKS